MRDHDDCHTQFFLQSHHQFQDLCLNCHIQCCSRFVSNQYIRFAGKRHGNHNTLTHSSGKFIGILMDPFLRFGNTDKLQHFQCAFLCLFPVAVSMENNSFPELVADCKRRIQRRHGILENNTDLIAADFSHFLIALAHQFFPVELD